jgi:hypothetical protein
MAREKRHVHQHVFPPFNSDTTPMEIMEFQMEIAEIWDGWKIEWTRVGRYQLAMTAVKCDEQEKQAPQEKSD